MTTTPAIFIAIAFAWNYTIFGIPTERVNIDKVDWYNMHWWTKKPAQWHKVFQIRRCNVHDVTMPKSYSTKGYSLSINVLIFKETF